MPDDTPATGFRSLVEKIQENDVDVRPQRRRLTMPRRAPGAPALDDDRQRPPKPVTAPRLLSRRWL